MRIEHNHPLAPYTTFGIGGPARYFCKAESVEDVKQAIAFAKEKEIPYHIIGKGSNTLFDDRGFAGLIILNALVFKRDFEGGVEVGAGYNFSQLGSSTARHHLTGLEFATGIPGTVGGAIFMNAGAGGREVQDAIKAVDYLHEDGRIQQFTREEITFRYRWSSFHEMHGCILAGAFALAPSKTAKEDQKKILDYRLKTQPYGEKSAGCCFRNPEGASAGALIEKYGLKGKTRGGAQVSNVHANFIINAGDATAEDIVGLLSDLQREVKEKSGYELQHEVRYIPYDV